MEKHQETEDLQKSRWIFRSYFYEGHAKNSVTHQQRGTEGGGSYRRLLKGSKPEKFPQTSDITEMAANPWFPNIPLTSSIQPRLEVSVPYLRPPICGEISWGEEGIPFPKAISKTGSVLCDYTLVLCNYGNYTPSPSRQKVGGQRGASSLKQHLISQAFILPSRNRDA